jgi:enamine deaminase RidA (YjgF/YER057c/UK114 family)
VATKFFNPRDVHPPVGPYSHTVVVPAGAELVFVAGQVGMRADGSVPEAFSDQAEVTFQNLRACLAAHGLGVEAVIKLGVFVLPGQDFKVLRAVRERHFAAHRPTSTTVYVPHLASPAFLIEVEAVAVKTGTARKRQPKRARRRKRVRL